jgi:23S rRNA (guanosine2251-2'-O)-methyltransferase
VADARSRLREDGWYGGFHAVYSALEAGRLREIWVDMQRQSQRAQALVARAQAFGVFVHDASPRTLDRLLPEFRHQGVVARGKAKAAGDEQVLWTLLRTLEEPPFLLVLDQVQDPHNLGAALRCAAAAGAHAIIIPRDRAAGLTSAVRKVASGATEKVPLIQVTNLARLVGSLRERGVRVVGAAPDGPVSLYAANLRGPLALALGGEHRGLRRLTRERCDLVVHIPMRGEIESLNVSAAAAVCLFEARRQRDPEYGPSTR